MTADSKECNGGCEGQKVESERRVGLEVVLEGDRKRKEGHNGIACREGEENGRDGSEGSFVMVNEDSDNPAGRDLDPRGEADPVVAEESGGPPANVGSLLVDVAFGDREADGEMGGDRKEGVDSVVNSATGVEDREDETAVSDSAEEETMEFKTNAVAEVEVRKEEESRGPGDSKWNNGLANNEVKLGERKEEIVAIETELKAEPESLAEIQEKLETAMTETDEERQEPETVVTETDHQGKLDVGAETKDQLESGSPEVEKKQEYMSVSMESDHQAESKSEVENLVTETEHQLESESPVEVQNLDALTATRGTHDQVEANSAVVVEAQEPQIASKERNDQEQSEVVVQKEDIQEPLTLGSEIKDQAELQSAEVESKEETEVASDQDEPEPIVKVGEEQKPESLVTETLASKSVPVEYEEVRLSNEAEEGPSDECSAENAAASELQCETSLQKSESSESAESHEASITSHLDVMVKEAEPSGDPESSKNSSVYHVGDLEFLKEAKVTTKSSENGENSPTETETVIHSADEPRPSGPVSAADVESEIIKTSINSGVEIENSLVPSAESRVVCSNNDTLESKVCNDMEIENHAVAMESDSRIGNDSAESGEYLASYVEDDQATRKGDDEESICQEVEAVKVIQAPPEDPSGAALDREGMDIQVAKKQPCYIIRVPRFTDDELWTQIQHAKLELEEKTQSRDSIRVSVQKKKATCNEYREKLETAKAKEKAVRGAYSAKRQEIESVQSTLNKIKNATSIEEIDNKIEAMDREFQHSTMGLKEEKQHLLNIKQLRQRREQLSSNMGSKSEIDMAFDQRDQIEESFKTLKKELDSLKADLSEAEIKAKEAWKEYDDKVRHLRVLQEQFRTADEIRQKAYGHWRNLKDESIEKSKYFYMYKNDQEAAANYLSSGDRKGLLLHCSKQVEKIMELWNNNDEFRMQYVESNKNSTLRRLKTLDGRSLGPDEEPRAPRSTVDKSSSFVSNPSNANPPVAVIASEAKPEKLDVLASPKVESFQPLLTAQTNQSSRSKKSTKTGSKETVMAPVSDREEVEAAPNENSRTKEEEEQARKVEELARKEEELRKEKAEAEMKERLRLEQKAKAKEAEERKRRKAEKAQARAEYRAQKEAELREKNKLKKEKKKTAATSNTANDGDGDHAPAAATDSRPPENAPEHDNQSVTASKRPSRPSVAAKQYNKTPPVPLPIRNRGKRKIRTWMWVVLTTLLVLALFLAGNYISFSFSL